MGSVPNRIAFYSNELFVIAEFKIVSGLFKKTAARTS